MSRVLTFDFGASGGRAVVFELRCGKLESQEVHRFSNDPVSVNGTLYWDVLRLFYEIKTAIVNAKNAGGFDSIGIDTWGVDFALIDEHGDMLASPVHYRDARTVGIIEEVDKNIPRERLYAQTGLQFLRFNSLYQLYYLKKYRQSLLASAKKMLFMPDLFANFLTGEMRAEFSMASTTAMIDQNTCDWNRELLTQLGLPHELLAPIIFEGETYGNLKLDIADELGVPRVPVIAVCAHDTASAVVAVPSRAPDFMYLSCGTWSLLGTELDRPVLTADACRAGLTNERGIRRTTRLLKNIMGLWIIQECRRQWAREGQEISFAEIAALAEHAAPFRNFIDVDDPMFELPGDMPKRIHDYCVAHNQPPPESIGETARCVYESLAAKYRITIEKIERMTGKKCSVLHIVGGGSNAEILCQFTANALGIKVTAGPSEATATGNALVQLIARGDVRDIYEARGLVLDSFDIKEYFVEGGHDAFGDYIEKNFRRN